MADYSERLGLELMRLSSETETKIENIIPPYGSALNPIDITAQALKEQEILTDSLEVLIDDALVDVIVVQTTFGGELGKKICSKIAAIDKKTNKPIVVTITGASEITGEGRAILEYEGVPVYTTSYKTMLAIKYLVEFTSFCNKSDSELSEQPLDKEDKAEKMRGVWTEDQVKHKLSTLGVRTPKGIIIKEHNQLEKAIEQLSYPVVSKVISDEVLHKTDVGAVKTHIRNAQELEEAFTNIHHSVKNYIPDAHIDGVLVEEMIEEKGIEMFIGVKEDSQFGSLIVCGIGGIFIEVLQDISIRKTPIDHIVAKKMLEELEGYPILKGVRGEKQKDIHALTEALVRVSEFASQYSSKIKEMDINPVMVLEDGKGVIALDGMIAWKDEKELKSSTASK